MTAALAYALTYVLLTVPGWPIGRAIFGRGNPVGWVAGAALGYGISAVALWIPIRLGWPTRPAFVVTWIVVAVAAAPLARFLRAALAMPRWTGRDTRALLAVMGLVALLMFPLARLGERDTEGNRLYRAYFTADFIWHTALASELGKYEMPPRNPYLAREPMHYYWTYFIPPSVIAASGPALLRDVQTVLKVNAFMTAMLFTAVLFCLARACLGQAAAAAGGIAIGIVAASAEGAAAALDLLQRDRPLALLRHVNVDAIAAWWWGGLRIDSLMRALWYNPQHSTSCALGMVACLVAVAGGATMPARSAALAGLALAFAVAFNPFIGAVFGVVYALVVVADAVRQRSIRSLARHWVAPAFAVAALGWCVANQMLEGAGGDLHVGFAGLARRAPFATLALSLGPLIAAAAVGAARRRAGAPPRGLALGAAMSGVALALLYLVRLMSNDAWVGFRAGQILQIGLVLLAARMFLPWKRRPAAVAAGFVTAAIVLTGAPTTLIDTYNAQDVSNREQGPGFRWTVAVTPAEQAAFAWIRRATAADAVVQMDPLAHGRETWSLIPTFASRRMAAGLTISLLPRPVYEELAARISSSVFAAQDASAAAAQARALGIDYIYMDSRERSFHGAALEKFSASPFFYPVYRNEEVQIYAVR